MLLSLVSVTTATERKCFLVSCSGGQSQLVCSGCRNLLLYPQGAKSVCCAVCRAVTTVPPPGNLIFSPSPSSLSCTAHSERSGSLRGLLNDRFLLFNVHSEQMFEFAAGTEMAQLICGGCHTLLMYIRGASSVQCSCCHTVNLALEGKQVLLIKSPVSDLLAEFLIT